MIRAWIRRRLVAWLWPEIRVRVRDDARLIRIPPSPGKTELPDSATLNDVILRAVQFTKEWLNRPNGEGAGEDAE